MKKFLVRFFFCVTILSLNVQSQYHNNGFAVTPGVGGRQEDSQELDHAYAVTPGVDSDTSNEIGYYHDERGFSFPFFKIPKIELPKIQIPNIFGFLKPPSKPSHKLKNGTIVFEQSPFEKTYRARVAMIQKLGDTIHDEFEDFTKFMLLFVGKDRRSLLSIRNVNEIKKLGERVISILIISGTLIGKLIEDGQSIFDTFTTKPNKVLKLVMWQVLKAIPLLPEVTRDLINNTLDKFIKD